MKEDLTLLQLEVENIKRLKVVQISPKDNMVIISGPNEAGKSTILDTILSAITGKSIGTQPIRSGKDKGKVFVVLGKDGEPKYNITRSFSEKGSRLIVKGADGGTFASPQALLDSFKVDLTFDPGQFAKANPAKQTELLLKVSNLPLDRARLATLSGLELNVPPLEYFKEALSAVELLRRNAGHDLKKSLFVLAENLKLPSSASEEEIKVSLDSIDPPQEKVIVENLLKQQSELVTERNRIVKDEMQLEAKKQEAEGLRKLLADLIERINSAKKEIANKEKEIEIETKSMTETAEIDPQLAAVREAIMDAGRINEEFQTAATLKKLAETYKTDKAEWKRFQIAIEEIRNYRKEVLAKAKFPVPGLSITEDGLITLDDIPLQQRGTSKQLLLGMTISAALHPSIKVILIREGNSFDKEAWTKISAWAKAKGYQVWIEKVADSPDGVSFYVEEGLIRQEPSEVE